MNSPTAKTRAELKKEKNQTKGPSKMKMAYEVFAQEKKEALEKEDSCRCWY